MPAVIPAPAATVRRVSARVRAVWTYRDECLRRRPLAARAHRILSLAALALWVVLFVLSQSAGAQTPTPDIPQLPPAIPTAPTPGAGGPQTPVVPAPQAPAAPDGGASIDIALPDVQDDPSTSVLIVIGLTLLTLAPSLLIMTTSFTRIVIVLSITRNALGLPAIPPNQVLTGLALFLTLFVMAPTLSEMNEVGLQPLLNGDKSVQEAATDASGPLREFMLANTRRSELNAMIGMSGEERPATPADVSLATLIPAFILSELKTAFIIGFAIFIPFLVIDLAVSAVLMSLGMMMLPPAFVALPFKLLLFVMVDGWGLVTDSIVRSFN